MAIDALVKSGSQSKWGFFQESAFGTVLNPQLNYSIVESEIPSIDYGVTQIQDVKRRGQRYADKNDTYLSEKSGVRVISMPEHPVRGDELAELLYAVLQITSEAVGSPFQKDFDIVKATTQPNFGSNAGYYATIYINNVLASRDQSFTSCILRSLTLKANTAEGDGRLMGSGDWISGFASSNAVNHAGGAPEVFPGGFYEFSSPSKQQIAGVDIVVADWEYTINNNAVRIGNTSAGECDTYHVGAPYDITGSLTIKWDQASDAELANFLSKTSVKLQLSVGSAGSEGYFDATFNAIEYTGNDRGFGDQKGQMVTLPWKAVGNDTTTGLCDFQVDDDNDQSW